MSHYTYTCACKCVVLTHVPPTHGPAYSYCVWKSPHTPAPGTASQLLDAPCCPAKSPAAIAPSCNPSSPSSERVPTIGLVEDMVDGHLRFFHHQTHHLCKQHRIDTCRVDPRCKIGSMATCMRSVVQVKWVGGAAVAVHASHNTPRSSQPCNQHRICVPWHAFASSIVEQISQHLLLWFDLS